MTIKETVAEFAKRLQELIEAEAVGRARAAVLQAFGAAPPRRSNGASPSIAKTGGASKRTRRKLPRQLCPVPGCTNTAAPVFGMVCAKHKDVAKSKLRKYREARRAKKLGAKARSKN
jgi:hypothetical protein